MRDFKRMQSDPPEGVNGAPLDNDIMQWQAVIFGPEDTAWEVCAATPHARASTEARRSMRLGGSKS